MVYWLKGKQETCYTLLHRHAQVLAEKQKFKIKVESEPGKETKEDDGDDEEEHKKLNSLETNLDLRVSYDDFKLSMHIYKNLSKIFNY